MANARHVDQVANLGALFYSYLCALSLLFRALYIMHYYDICVRLGFAVSVVVSLLFPLSPWIYFHILYCLNFWLRVFDSGSGSVRERIRDRFRFRGGLLFAPAFIIYANFCCVLCCLNRFGVPFECTRKKNVYLYIHIYIYKIKAVQKQNNN